MLILKPFVQHIPINTGTLSQNAIFSGQTTTLTITLANPPNPGDRVPVFVEVDPPNALSVDSCCKDVNGPNTQAMFTFTAQTVTTSPTTVTINAGVLSQNVITVKVNVCSPSPRPCPAPINGVPVRDRDRKNVKERKPRKK